MTTTFKLTPQNISRLCLLFLVLAVIGAVLSIQFAANYPPRRCTFLIDCVYGKMTQVQVADTAIGGTLAGLLPTILVLLGACSSALSCLSRPPEVSIRYNADIVHLAERTP
jgi:hypothetical protein